jgi:hypothetical protein
MIEIVSKLSEKLLACEYIHHDLSKSEVGFYCLAFKSVLCAIYLYVYHPGVEYSIKVFTENDLFNSSRGLNATRGGGVTTKPDGKANLSF